MINQCFTVEKLRVYVFPDRRALGEQAAKDVAGKIRELLANKQEINMVFAAAPSQNEFLAALAGNREIDFNRIHAFHMDEYIGLAGDAPQSFGRFLEERLFSKVPFASVRYINGNAENPKKECNRYEELLKRYPLDIVCLGIGVNCHLAFNDPPADLEDTTLVKVVSLEKRCREQQVHDGCFKTIDEVPDMAITLTIPALMAAPYVFGMVPGKSKAEAVYRTLLERISPFCPSVMLRRHAGAALYLDEDSAALLGGKG